MGGGGGLDPGSLHWLLLCADDSSPRLNDGSKELYLALLNCTSEANMLFNPSRAILTEWNGAMHVCLCVCVLHPVPAIKTY